MTHPRVAAWYTEYLQGEHWNRLRDKILKKRGRVCQDCNHRCYPVLHHTTYARIGHERQADLRVLCQSCHRKRHRRYVVPYIWFIYCKDWKGIVRPWVQKSRGSVLIEVERNYNTIENGGVRG